jgi:bacillithiol system protein YtxJ
MGLFDKLFNSSSETIDKKELQWIQLNSINQLNKIKDKSTNKTQIIFKHSTRCGTSRMVLKQFERNYIFSENEIDIYYLDLITYRDVSNKIESQFNVFHESPQLLVVKNGVVVAHSSHGAINNINLAQFI